MVQGQQVFRYYGNVLSLSQASATSDGYLSKEDWLRFNNTSIGFAPVQSVFGRQGAVIAQQADYSAFYASVAQGVPAGGAAGQVLMKSAAADFSMSWSPVTLSLPAVFSGLRIKADGSFQLWNPDQNKYHTLQVRGLAGAEYLTIGAGET
jgi:hypothetical protein